MTAETFETITGAAAKAGAEHGRAVASWYEVTDVTAAAILQGIEDGDPETLDTFPSAPLSGEWAGDPTPQSVLLELGADVAQLTPEDEDDVLRAYEDAFIEAAADEIERRARLYDARGHVVGSITCSCDAPESHPPSITYPAP